MHSHVYLEIIWLPKHSTADITCGAIRLGNLVSSLLCHRLILTLQGRLRAIFRLIDLFQVKMKNICNQVIYDADASGFHA